jgi:hypothetical protein
VLVLSKYETLLRNKVKWIKSQISSNNLVAFRLHPLGFFYAESVGIETIEPYSLHFWPDGGVQRKQSNEYFIHDHAYGFASLVISGMCEQKIYTDDSSPESVSYSKYDVLYQEHKSILRKTTIQKSLKCSLEFLIGAGSAYSIEARTLHTFEVKASNTLTLILKEAPDRPATASVFGPITGRDRLEFDRITLDKETNEALNSQMAFLLSLRLKQASGRTQYGRAQ